MKRIILVTIALLSVVCAWGNSKKIYPFKADADKGLYIGVTSADNILTGQQDALAMALNNFAFHMQTKVESRVSYSTKEDSSAEPSSSSTSASMHYCDIRIVDRATVDGNEFILFKIVSGGDYKLSINFKATTSATDTEITELIQIRLSLSLNDPSGKEVLNWDWAESSLKKNGEEQRTLHSMVSQQN